MMDTTTSPAVHSTLPEITEKPEDTPHATVPAQRPSLTGAVAFALTSVVMTPLMTGYDPFFNTQDRTPLIEERHAEESFFPPSGTAVAPIDMSQLSAADTANRDRLVLLARQYVTRSLSTEEEARLAIVSERVRRLIPRVTAADFEVLEQMLEDVQRIELADITRRQCLGIA